MAKKQIGYVEATIRTPIYEGDRTDHLSTADWYQYSEPGITPRGNLGTCERNSKLVGEATVVLYEQAVRAKA